MRDLYASYKADVDRDATLDVGFTWSRYPGGFDTIDFAEPYAKLSGTLGPPTVLVRITPKQRALGNFSNTPASRGKSQDNLYVWGDLSSGIPGTPVTAKADLGYSDGNPGLGPNGTSLAPTGSYIDYLVGADVVLGRLTLGVAYTGTDIGRAESAYLLPNFSSTKDGSSIAAGKVLFSVSASF